MKNLRKGNATVGLQLESLKKSYEGTTVVDGVDLDVEPGALIALLGPSGCGKSTTLRMIAGFEEPDSGRIVVDSRDVTHLAPGKRGLGMVFQNYSLFPHMTVSENVAFGLRMNRVGRSEIEDRVRSALDMVALSQFAARYPGQLSGGQQQRVALARSLVPNPKVLLLDEPLGALDKHLRESMQYELRSMQQNLGITTVIVTHDQEEALSMSDQIAVMNKGRVLQVGNVGNIYDRPHTRFVAEFLGAANIFRGELRQGQDLIFLETGISKEPIRIPFLSREMSSGPVALSVRPERIHIVSEGSPAHFSRPFAGVIRSAMFRGAYVAYRITLDELAEPVLVYKPSDGPLGTIRHQVGSRVNIGWHSEEAIIVKEDM